MTENGKNGGRMTEKSKKLNLNLPVKSVKKQKGFYLEMGVIDFFKEESTKLKVSENVLLTALVDFYKSNAK